MASRGRSETGQRRDAGCQFLLHRALLVLLARSLARCPETGHLSFVSSRMASSWAVGAPGLPASLGGMGRAGSVTRAVVSIAAWPLIIIFSPVIVLVGEPINRQIMRRARWSASTTAMAVDRHSGEPALATAVRLPLRSSRFLTVISNPLWIALTAPGRWAGGWFRTQPHEPAGPLSGTRPPCAGQLATTARR